VAREPGSRDARGATDVEDYRPPPDPELPDPELPDPELPDPELPDPELLDPELAEPELPDPELPGPERPEPPVEVGVGPPPGPELSEPRPRFPLRAVVAVLPGVVPPGPSTVDGVVPPVVRVPPVVGVLPDVESVPPVVGVVTADESGPSVELVRSPGTTPVELVLAPPPSSAEDVAAKALPAVRSPATAKAAMAGEKAGRGI
jgi:hypothetical protein